MRFVRLEGNRRGRPVTESSAPNRGRFMISMQLPPQMSAAGPGRVSAQPKGKFMRQVNAGKRFAVVTGMAFALLLPLPAVAQNERALTVVSDWRAGLKN